MEKKILNYKKIIDTTLKNELIKIKTGTNLDEMMEYALLLGGKRIRPIIMYILADIYNKEYKQIEKEAVAIEMIHSYSLVHDDLPSMDNDEYRRGNLTIHKKYGEANAILIGDALLTHSFSVLASSKYSNKNSIIALSYFSGIKGMILGQYLDIISENESIDFERLLEIHINKTAMLLISSVELASISLRLNEDIRKLLRKYIFYLGIAYQIQDDILEEEQSFEILGKTNTDRNNKKSTFPSIIGLEKSKEFLREYTNRAINLVKDNNMLVEFANYLLKREK